MLNSHINLKAMEGDMVAFASVMGRSKQQNGLTAAKGVSSVIG